MGEVIYPGIFGLSHPDFAIIGVPMPNGWVRLVASKELTHGELMVEVLHQRVEFEYLDVPPVALLSGYTIEAKVGLRTFTIIDAPDYATALRSLLEGWSPDRPEQAAIEPPQKAIER